jgi:hypothetical protein
MPLCVSGCQRAVVSAAELRAQLVERAEPVHDRATGYRDWPSGEELSDDVVCLWSRGPVGPSGAGLVVPDACMDIIWDGTSLFVAGPDTGPVTVDRRGQNLRRAPFPSGPGASLPGRPGVGTFGREARAGRTVGPSRRRPSQRRATLRARPICRRRGTGSRRTGPGPICPPTRPIGGRPGGLVGPRATLNRRRGQSGPKPGSGGASAIPHCSGAVGYGPKMLERVLRFARAQHLAESEPNLARVAAAAGYADQAMARDCRRLAGRPPSDLVKAQR